MISNIDGATVAEVRSSLSAALSLPIGTLRGDGDTVINQAINHNYKNNRLQMLDILELDIPDDHPDIIAQRRATTCEDVTGPGQHERVRRGQEKFHAGSGAGERYQGGARLAAARRAHDRSFSCCYLCGKKLWNKYLDRDTPVQRATAIRGGTGIQCEGSLACDHVIPVKTMLLCLEYNPNLFWNFQLVHAKCNEQSRICCENNTYLFGGLLDLWEKVGTNEFPGPSGLNCEYCWSTPESRKKQCQAMLAQILNNLRVISMKEQLSRLVTLSIAQNILRDSQNLAILALSNSEQAMEIQKRFGDPKWIRQLGYPPVKAERAINYYAEAQLMVLRIIATQNRGAQQATRQAEEALAQAETAPTPEAREVYLRNAWEKKTLSDLLIAQSVILTAHIESQLPPGAPGTSFGKRYYTKSLRISTRYKSKKYIEKVVKLAKKYRIKLDKNTVKNIKLVKKLHEKAKKNEN